HEHQRHVAGAAEVVLPCAAGVLRGLVEAPLQLACFEPVGIWSARWELSAALRPPRAPRAQDGCQHDDCYLDPNEPIPHLASSVARPLCLEACCAGSLFPALAGQFLRALFDAAAREMVDFQAIAKTVTGNVGRAPGAERAAWYGARAAAGTS